MVVGYNRQLVVVCRGGWSRTKCAIVSFVFGRPRMTCRGCRNRESRQGGFQCIKGQYGMVWYGTIPYLTIPYLTFTVSLARNSQKSEHFHGARRKFLLDKVWYHTVGMYGMMLHALYGTP